MPRISTLTISLTAVLLFSSAFAQSPRSAAIAALPTHVPDQLVVGFRPGTAATAKADAHRRANARVLRRLDAIDAAVVQVAAGTLAEKAAVYRSNPNVRYAEPNRLRPVFIPNEGQDPPPPFGLGIDYFDEQWGFHNTGQSFFYDQFTGQPGALTGVPDADIDATEAWDLSAGSPTVTVAVLDTGIDCDHADLIGKCVEIANFGQSNTPEDELGHGTHVAGIIAASTNNGIGVAGLGRDATLASLKVCYEAFDPFFGLVGLCDDAASAQGMIHAADQGYQVINMSYAGPTPSQVEADAAAYAWNNGVLLAAAAANNYSMSMMYPAGFPQVIAVAASDYYDNLAGFSNFGSSWVAIAAPGDTVFSTMPHAACGIPDSDPEGCYGWLSGTSMASPMVAGAAALIWAHMGAGATNALVRSAIENNADQTGALGQNFLAWTTYGRLNVHAAMTGSGGPPPPGDPGAHIGDLDGSRTSSGPNWTARVTVTVHDENEAVVAGASVQGSWTGGYTGAAGCTTSGNGTCTVQTAGMPKRSGSATFTISNIAGTVYQAAANHDPDGDSNGSSITVAK